MKLDKFIEFVTVRPKLNKGKPTGEIEEKVIYGCHANYFDVSGTEFNKNATTFEQLKGSFRVRYCNNTKDLDTHTKDYKIKFKGNLWDIQHAADFKQLHQWIDVKAILIK